MFSDTESVLINKFVLIDREFFYVYPLKLLVFITIQDRSLTIVTYRYTANVIQRKNKSEKKNNKQFYKFTLILK